MPLMDAQQKKTEAQIDVNEALRHSALGIRAGLPLEVCQCIQHGKTSNRVRETASRVAFCAYPRLKYDDVVMARTYINKPSAVLRTIAPTQSISANRRDHFLSV